ncbi:hypothetical protein PYV02_10905 [Leifsonia sp. H3M29-4]|uniref:hypothetical protein n=1 Tax=Salinibacterium metalliresistens TaxID=3031321 RepID=UPI0023D9E7A9|nr:hypothetical protein [Salinibacterium metalliresistens]MDF1479590.1 hypothetical protein [Salinibacterium metalliresistens]
MTDETPTEPRTWIAEWVRTESFWRDVTTRTFSGIVVVTITGLVAGMAAWAASDSIRPTVASIGAGALVILAAFAAAVAWFRFSFWNPITKRRVVGRWRTAGLWVLMVAGILAIAYLVLVPGQLFVDWVYGQA